ncbi:MAG TPA: PAS domain S-box protein [Opitutaceae bacterium]|jgi:PAS domain S-box-containing protein
MIPAKATPDEPLRLEALRRYEVLDTLPEKALDDLAALSAELCGVPMAQVSLVDEDRQWFKARVGVDLTETPRAISFCGHAIQQRELFMVADAKKDERFADNPLVKGEPGIRFYAGAPLVTPDGAAIGALCVMDRKPRVLTEAQKRVLRVLSRQVMIHLELRRQARGLVESEERLRIVTENSRVGLVMVDRNRRYAFANGAYSELFGLPSPDIVGRLVCEVLPAQYETQIKPRLDLAFSGKRVSYVLQRPSVGGERHYEICYEPKLVEGEVALVIVVVVDISERLATEAIVKQFPAIIESSDDAIISKTLDGIVSSWNPAAETMFGYTAAEIVGQPITVLFPPDRLQEENEILARIKKGERVRHFETVRVRKDGRKLEVSATISPIRDSQGRIAGVSKIVRDITQRKQAEEQILWRTALFEAQVDSALDGLLIVDNDAKTILQNRRMVEIWRFPKEIAEQTDDAVRLRWVTSQVKRPDEYVEKVSYLNGHPDEVSRDEIELVDGRVFDRYSAPVRGKDGRHYGRIWAFRDMTEQKRAQEQIEEQAALLDKARDAITVRDTEGKILFWNHGAERMYGWKREEAIGRNVADLLYADPKKFAEFKSMILDKAEWSGELRQRTKDHGEISIEARWTLIRDPLGQPKTILAINTDITEKKKIEAQFLRAQRMESIGTLAGGVAHDLNNILAPIMMSIELLKVLSDKPEATKMLETIEVSAKRGAEIVRQVLSFARGMQGERIEVQPKHLLNDLENIIRNTFPKDIRLHFSVARDTWTILGDPTQVHQVLLNLSVNARDAMPRGGSLTVSAENCVLDEQYSAMNLQAKPGRYVMINVTDTGTGIPSAILNKIFEPFFTTKDPGKGTGLGLSTVMAVVKSHDGIVNVYSEPDRGTTFKVYFPALEVSSEARKEQLEQASLPRGKGELILIVDDEASVLTITSQTLQAFGYRVLTASNGADAVGVYVENKNAVAAVLTDMMMPIMDGPATIHALKRIDPSVRIIAASGLNENGGVAKVTGDGVKHFLVKPYTAATLLKTLRVVLDEKKEGKVPAR